MTPEPLRIVQVASGREWRGGQNQVWLLARALADRPRILDQVVVTTRGSLLDQRLRATGVRVRAAGWRAGLSPTALLATVRESAGGRAILHAHDAHALTLSAIASRLTGAPYIATRRVDFHLRHPGPWRGAARIVAISEAVRDVLVADGIDPRRIVRVHSGIDLESVRRAKAGDVRRRLGLPEGSPLAVTVGALVGHKDHPTLVAAAAAVRARCPDLHWAIAGEGPLRPLLESLIRESGLQDRVHLLGHLAEPLPLVASADLFVMSSREEGLGTSVLDAMALDVPIAATAAGGIPEMLHGGAGLLSPPENPAALGESVLRILEQPALRTALIREARNRVEEFSATAMAEGVLSVYRSVAGER